MKPRSCSNDSETPKTQIDEELYNRQLYVLGHQAMQKILNSNILIIGLNGLGVEIAKNVILAGVHSVFILDDTPVSAKDLSSQFYLKPAHIGVQTRAQASLNDLKHLNRYVKVEQITGTPTADLLKTNEIDVVVSVNQTIAHNLGLNEKTRQTGAKLVIADVYGLFGSVFVDNGNDFCIVDVDGLPPKTGIIESLTKQGENVVVMVSEENRHGLSVGSVVTFSEVEGMALLNGRLCGVVDVLGPYGFVVEGTLDLGDYVSGGIFAEVKMPKTVSFRTLKENLDDPQDLTVVDFAKMDRPSQLLRLYKALNAFREQNGRLPVPNDLKDAVKVAISAQNGVENAGKSDNNEKSLFLALARCSSAVLAPMASAIGGIAAQEVIKSVSGKFSPIMQHLLFDAAECCPPLNESTDLTQFAPQNTRYDDTVAVFGVNILEKLKRLKLFLVGAGAIGCEILKNWAMMGVACGEGGGINVTDMDSIEKSNLNRQFLFRDTDVGELKSKIAASAAQRMNPEIRISAQSNRLGKETENIYNDDFWENLDAVCSALDNVETRLYADEKCVVYKKPLFESGTLGTQGNTQVIIPHKTESYGSSRDPPEKSVPMCTLKNFPNKIEHTIQWARDLFEGLFRQGPEDANGYIENEDFVRNLLENSSAVQETVKNLQSLLGGSRCERYEDCVRWGRRLYEELFSVRIRELLFAFPLDHVTSAGNRFWSGPKRAPTPLDFDVNDKTSYDFIISAANLRSENYKIAAPQSPPSPEAISLILKTCDLPQFVPSKKIAIATTDAEMERQREQSARSLDTEEVMAALPPCAGVKLELIVFEKDDGTNFHMAFVTACANLRARNYAIGEASLHECKLIAGKIIPAIATTTALVSGLICLEMYKYLQKAPLESYKNCYLCLALPFFTFSEPMTPPKTKSQVGGKPSDFTLWDNIVIDEGDISLGQLLKYFQNTLKLKLQILSCNPSLIYASFFPASSLKESMDRPISLTVAEALKITLPADQKYIRFEAEVTDLSGDEVEIPSVVVKLRN